MIFECKTTLAAFLNIHMERTTSIQDDRVQGKDPLFLAFKNINAIALVPR